MQYLISYRVVNTEQIPHIEKVPEMTKILFYRWKLRRRIRKS